MSPFIYSTSSLAAILETSSRVYLVATRLWSRFVQICACYLTIQPTTLVGAFEIRSRTLVYEQLETRESLTLTPNPNGKLVESDYWYASCPLYCKLADAHLYTSRPQWRPVYLLGKNRVRVGPTIWRLLLFLVLLSKQQTLPEFASLCTNNSLKSRLDMKDNKRYITISLPAST